MKDESNVSGHWTDEELVAHVYGVGPEKGHLDQCAECQGRFASMLAHRNMLERSAPQKDVSVEFLAAQRRSIYARLTISQHWPLRRWASVATGVLIMGGGMLVYQQQRHMVDNRISDAQLAADVSRMAADAEPDSTAPLQALFEE
jgi:predicted anti-sigma-YlaC factor YlaD